MVVVTARERHDWVNAGIALRRRATVAAEAAFRKNGCGIAAMVGREHYHGADDRGGGSTGGETSGSSVGVGGGGGSGGGNDAEGGEDYVERVLRTRAAVDAMLSEQDAARTARLADFVEREIASIRGEQAEEYALLAKEEAELFRNLHMIESALDAQTPSRAATEKPAIIATTRAGTSGIGGGGVAQTHDTPAAVAAYDDFMEMSGPTGGVRQQQQQFLPTHPHHATNAYRNYG